MSTIAQDPLRQERRRHELAAAGCGCSPSWRILRGDDIDGVMHIHEAELYELALAPKPGQVFTSSSTRLGRIVGRRVFWADEQRTRKPRRPSSCSTSSRSVSAGSYLGASRVNWREGFTLSQSRRRTGG